MLKNYGFHAESPNKYAKYRIFCGISTSKMSKAYLEIQKETFPCGQTPFSDTYSSTAAGGSSSPSHLFWCR